MNLAVSSYYTSNKSNNRNTKAQQEAATISLINNVRLEWPAYGYRRVTAELRRRGVIINHKRIARIMREHPLKFSTKARKPKPKKTGEVGAAFPFVAKSFNPEGPNQLWVTDITYIRLRSGFIYLAVMIDAWSRMVVGYAVSKHIDARLVTVTLKRAFESRKPNPGLIHHSDQGSQYHAKSYQLKLAEYGMVGSMSRKGKPIDNPQAESSMKTLKYEEVYQYGYESIDDVRRRLPEFIEKIYNRKRIHSALGYLTPEEYELKHAAIGSK